MSDLKKILKEEYAKKKLNITPKLLMEMIEQVMFEEKTDSNLEQAQAFFKGTGAELDQKSKTRLIVRVDDRDDFKNQIEARLKLAGYVWDETPGSDSSIGRFRQKETKNPGFNVIVLKNRSNAPRPKGTVSERFESNIIYALAPEKKKESVDASDRIGSEFPKYQEAADKLVKNLSKEGLSPGIYFKPGKGTVSALYNYFKVTNPTPKTDISDGKQINISVKKKGGGFLSSEVNETRALIAVALGFNNLKELQNSNQYNDLFNNLANMLGKDKWNAAGAGRRELGDAALEMIYEAVEGKIDDHQAKIVEEAMTGNNRFTTPVSVANRLLTWKLDGSGEYHNNLGDWAKENSNNFKFDIRWRGRGRSAGYRIDSTKSNQFIKKMNELYGIKSEEGRVDEREALKKALTRTALATAMIAGSPPADDQALREPPAIQIAVSDKADDVELKVVPEELKKIFIEELLDAPNDFDGVIYG
jgi:hypothetical protein